MKRGVSEKSIIILPPSSHTGAESRNLLLLAKERGWTKLAIASQPHHQLRCFLQIVALMSEVDYYPAVYNAPPPPIAWNYPMTKPVMAGGTAMTEDVMGTLPDHIAAEMERIVMYAQPLVDGGPKYTRNANFQEMFEYLDRRAKM